MRLRDLPSVDQLARGIDDPLAVDVARSLLDRAREQVHAGIDPGDLAGRLREELTAARAPRLRRVLNATGVIAHTNLGRAPLAEHALERVREVARGYSNLEYDLSAGGRGSRQAHVGGIIPRLTGAEGALVVNNNAAAVLLALAALAEGREVIVSRGELIEIGDGFRIPDVLARSGAILREVGTTNRTRAADYERAIGPETALLLRVHKSNFRVVGFTEQPSVAELAAVARRRELPLVDDLGSGAFLPFEDEPSARDSLAAGADLACFSGDKLLGGPQAGVIVGRADLIARLKKHPLTRAIRPDKATLAGLGATLVHYVRGEAQDRVPVWRMIAADPDQIEVRAWAVVGMLGSRGTGFGVEDGQSAVGGGSLPGETLPTRLLVGPPGLDAQAAAAALRQMSPPVIARVERDRLVLDLRTVLPEEDEVLARALVGVAECGL